MEMPWSSDETQGYPTLFTLNAAGRRSRAIAKIAILVAGAGSAGG